MSKLTDEQIEDLYFDEFSISKLKEFARAIEAAATEPLLQRIVELEAANEAFAKRQNQWNLRMIELERQLEEARKDAERYRWLFLPHTEESLSAAEQTQTMPAPTKQDAVIAHLSAWYTPKSKADSIIDAAMQKGQS